MQFLGANATRFAGRVGFVWMMGTCRPSPFAPDADLTSQPGVVGRADTFVKCEPQHTALVGPIARQVLDRRTRSITRWLWRNKQAQLANDLQLRHARRRSSPGRRHAHRRAAAASGARRQRPDLPPQPIAASCNDQLAAAGRPHRRGRGRRQRNAIGRSAARQQELEGHTAAHRQATDALAEHRVKLTAAEERRAAIPAAAGGAGRRVAGRLRAARRGHRPVGRIPRETRPARHGPGRDGNPPRPPCSSRSPATRSIGRPATARPRTPRSSWPRARSGCGTCERGCGSSTRPARSAAARSTKAACSLSFASSGPRPRAGTSSAPSRRSPSSYLRKEAFAAETVRFLNQREELQQQRNQLAADVANGPRAGTQDRRADTRPGPFGQRGPPGARDPRRPPARGLRHRAGRA